MSSGDNSSAFLVRRWHCVSNESSSTKDSVLVISCFSRATGMWMESWSVKIPDARQWNIFHFLRSADLFRKELGRDQNCMFSRCHCLCWGDFSSDGKIANLLRERKFTLNLLRKTKEHFFNSQEGSEILWKISETSGKIYGRSSRR